MWRDIMEFRDLKKQYQVLKKEIDSAVMKVMQNADFISGKAVADLEEALAAYVGVKHCITCGNGTDALELALLAWNVGAGDAVFVPDFTFFASGEAPVRCGATPVFVDVERDTFNISPKALEQAVQRIIEEGVLKPKVIVAVDLFGQPADYREIRKIADKYNIWILEDGAQGFGGAIGNQRACSFGDIATTSFFPAKPLGCYGDGGAVFTDNDEWAEIIHSLRIHGKGECKYDNVRIGMNSRLDTIQAAVLKVKLQYFDKEIKAVNSIAEIYNKQLVDKVEVPVVQTPYYSSWAQYTVVCKNVYERNMIQKNLAEYDIPSMIYYMKGMHEQVAFEDAQVLVGEYENTDYLKERVLSLPIYPYMSEKMLYMIVNQFHCDMTK